MKEITIEGKFSGSINNSVTLTVYRAAPLPDPYDFKKDYSGSFKEVLKDLADDRTYNIDFTGFTTGGFSLKISGEFEDPNPITDSFNAGGLLAGYSIHTNK